MTATSAPERPVEPSTAPPRSSSWRTILTIVLTALRRVARDRVGLFFIIVLPFLIILLFGIGGPRSGALPIGVVSDGSAGVERLITALEDEPALDVRTFADGEAMASAVRRDDLVGGVVVEADEDGGAEVRWLGDPGSEGMPAARVAVSSVVSHLDARLVAAEVGGTQLGLEREQALDLVGQADDRPALEVVEETVGGDAFSFGVAESAQSNLVLFVFITSLGAGAALIESRRLGVTHRMLASPASAPLLLAGEAAARFAIAMAQALIVLIGASLMFGVSWGDPLAITAILALFCLVGTGAAMLFGATLSNAEQASAIAAPLGIALGMLGGALWPLEIVPPFMKTVARAVPHSWAVEALREVSSRGGGIGDILVNLAVLAGFAVALLAVATWRLGVTLRRG